MSDRLLDGQRIFERAQLLAFPRYPGTPGDRRAIELVSDWFEAAELEVTREEFSYDIRPVFRWLSLLLAALAGLVVASALVSLAQPFIALLILALALVSGGALLSWSPWLERIYRSDGPTRTANVIGVRRALTGSPRARIILVAHHDSKSQNLTLPFRLLFTVGAIAGTLALAAFEIAGATAGAADPRAVLLAGGVATVSLLALSTLRSGNRSPGGVDNAGSVSTLAELASHLRAEVPGDVELVLLSPGAEEDHMVGAMRWLDRHAEKLSNAPVWAVNLDGAGIPGRLALLERFAFGSRFSPRLSEVAHRCAARLELDVRSTFLPPAMGVDAIPFYHRGIDCLTLASGSPGRAVFAVHSAADHGSNLDPQALEQAARLTRAIVLELAAD